MPFKKGQSGNPNGRTKGEKNKLTQDMREFVRLIIEGQQEQKRIDAALDELFEKDKDAYMRHMGGLIKQITPQGVDVTSKGKRLRGTQINLASVPDDVLDELMKYAQDEKDTED